MKMNVVCGVVMVWLTVAGVGLAAPTLDQEQSLVDYGYWFDLDDIRWQEFRPTLPVLEQVDLNLWRRGSPGDVVIEVRSRAGAATLWDTVVPEVLVPAAHGWVSIDVPSVLLAAEEPFRIYVSATQDSEAPENRYFWMGLLSDAYPRGVTSETSHQPNYDFAFRTYGSPAAVPAPGAILLGTLGAGLAGWLRRRRSL